MAQSKLQQLHCKTMWLINFRLHTLNSRELTGIVPSKRTLALAAQHSAIVADLKTSIKVDAANAKRLIKLRERK